MNLGKNRPYLYLQTAQVTQHTGATFCKPPFLTSPSLCQSVLSCCEQDPHFQIYLTQGLQDFSDTLLLKKADHVNRINMSVEGRCVFVYLDYIQVLCISNLPATLTATSCNFKELVDFFFQLQLLMYSEELPKQELNFFLAWFSLPQLTGLEYCRDSRADAVLPHSLVTHLQRCKLEA